MYIYIYIYIYIYTYIYNGNIERCPSVLNVTKLRETF